MTEKTLLWKCPRCGMVLEKSAQSAEFFQKQAAAGRHMSGTVACSNCQANFPIEDVYSGRYDVSEKGD